MADATIAAGYARSLVDFAVAKGAVRSALLARSGVRSAELERADARISLKHYLDLMKTATQLCDEPAFALQFGEAVRFEDVSIVGLICAAAKTIGEGREQLNRYARLMVDETDSATAPTLDLVRERGKAWLQLNGSVYAEHRELIESAFARNVCGARAGFAASTYFQTRQFPRAVHFTHKEPAYRAEYDRIFKAPLVFGSDRNALLIDEEFLAIELPPANRYVFGILSERAEALLEKLEKSKSIRGRVEATVLPILHTGGATMLQVARQLGFSRASLYRRLKEEGVTFEELLDELRHKMAIQYLQGKKVSVNEVAYLVGFSDPATFSRAFKRWTGKPPSRRSTDRAD